MAGNKQGRFSPRKIGARVVYYDLRSASKVSQSITCSTEHLNS